MQATVNGSNHWGPTFKESFRFSGLVPLGIRDTKKLKRKDTVNKSGSTA